MLNDFRKWRESQEQVQETRSETIEKEVALRIMKTHKRKLSEAETKRIRNEATAWVDNGIKATTDKRLKYLRVMFYYGFEKTQKITRADIPYFPILGAKVDNVKQGKFSREDLENIIKEMPEHEQLVRFLHLTGMRSSQAKAMTWDMIGRDDVLRMSGFLTKNNQPYSLELTDANGKPYAETAFMVHMKERPYGHPVFDTTGFREAWRVTCHKLKLGVYNTKTRSYRGAEPHDFRRTAATNLNDAGASETDGMSITGHKTNSMYKRYNIGGGAAQRRALGAVTTTVVK
jgi:integrase